MKNNTMKNESKFTPGPWFGFPASTKVFGQDKVLVADTSPDGDQFRPLPEALANARLIASAPDLAQACRRFENYAAQVFARNATPLEREILAQVRAALAKSAGETV